MKTSELTTQGNLEFLKVSDQAQQHTTSVISSEKTEIESEGLWSYKLYNYKEYALKWSVDKNTWCQSDLINKSVQSANSMKW